MNKKVIYCILLGVGTFCNVYGTKAYKICEIQKIVNNPIANINHSNLVLEKIGVDFCKDDQGQILYSCNQSAFSMYHDITHMLDIDGASKDKLMNIILDALLTFLVPDNRLSSVDAFQKIIGDSYILGLNFQHAFCAKCKDVLHFNEVKFSKMLSDYSLLLSKQISILTQEKSVRYTQMISNILGQVISSTIMRAFYSDLSATLDPGYVGGAIRYNLTAVQVLGLIHGIESGKDVKLDDIRPDAISQISLIREFIKETEKKGNDLGACCRLCSELIYLVRDCYVNDTDLKDIDEKMQYIVEYYKIPIDAQLTEFISSIKNTVIRIMDNEK